MLKESINKNKHKRYIKKRFGKYGKVVEEDNKIIVYISEGKVYANKYGIFSCDGINKSRDSEELLNKEVYYIFDNILFNNNCKIYGANAHLIFKKCTFENFIFISDSESITMEDNKYMFYGSKIKYIELNSHKITIRNNDFTNVSFAKKFDEPKVDISLLGNEINIENSNICSEYSGQISVIADTLVLNDSTINGPKVYLASDNIIARESVITSSSAIEIDNENCNFTSVVRAPKVVYNGMKLNSQSAILEIDSRKAELLKARTKLISLLHVINNRCEEENRQIVTGVKKRLEDKKISKVLRRTD